jgi:hypothetical protein
MNRIFVTWLACCAGVLVPSQAFGEARGFKVTTDSAGAAHPQPEPLRKRPDRTRRSRAR